MQLKFTKWRIITAFIIVVLIIYFIFTHLVLYCNDAYVHANLIHIAPRVSGNIVAIEVNNNQYVHAGDVLLKIDPVPFQLQANEATAELQQATAQIGVLQQQLTAFNEELVVSKKQLDLANLTLQRYQKLAINGDVSEQMLTDKQNAASTADASYLSALANVTRTEQQLIVQQATVADATNKLNLANYDLGYTTITAPTNGYINNLYLYPGSHVVASEALFGLLQSDSLQVIANYKEGALANIKPGQTVWVMLSSNWWHFYRGKVISYGRAVARDPAPVDPALPYIQPTTDWIRYPYRFPVTIALDPTPDEAPIAMGADAYTWILVL